MHALPPPAPHRRSRRAKVGARPRFRPLFTGCTVATGLALFTGCQSPATRALGPLQAIERPVDLPRFMGDWYVIAHIPLFPERHAHNAIERYELRADGRIDTTYTFNLGAPDGRERIFRPVGTVRNPATNAEWSMRFAPLLEGAFLIVYLDDHYQTTVIGVPNRRNVWLMSRSPEMDEARYLEFVDFLHDTGHDVTRLRRVPHGPAPTPAE
jgi:apolipoprotein D and lipocalin family protein